MEKTDKLIAALFARCIEHCVLDKSGELAWVGRDSKWLVAYLAGGIACILRHNRGKEFDRKGWLEASGVWRLSEAWLHLGEDPIPEQVCLNLDKYVFAQDFTAELNRRLEAIDKQEKGQ